MNDTIIYEHPLNETIRACLRLENLFHQLDHQLKDSSVLGTRNAIATIVHMLQLLDRPDLKAKLAKEMNSLYTNLLRFGNMPDIDSTKFSEVTQKLEEMSRTLIDSSGKIGHRLRDYEFLNNLRLQLTNPGGGCSFDIPLNHYWLQQPAHERSATLQNWLEDFELVKQSILLVLDLVRKNAKIEQKDAVHGFHQELLDPQLNLRMIRISIMSDIPAYPEISVGRHFFKCPFLLAGYQKASVTIFGESFFLALLL